ncbi:MAG TPA: glycosyltransferase family 39 protein [Verrucomicrobiae bacterium]|nr:glycosyltransferase family 39 protein [Verrucomicrobiae bacterium]
MNIKSESERPVTVASRAGAFVHVTFLLVVFILISVSSSLEQSPTFDEPLHLFAGYSYLKWHDFRANPEHPPFAKMWAALPLLAMNIKDPRPGRAHWDWMVADQRIALAERIDRDMFADNDSKKLFLCAKLQMIVLATVLGVFIYLWGKELFGVEAGLAALFLFVLDPNFLAHGQIVHTDVPFAVFGFIATFFFWRYLQRANWTNLLFFSLFMALAAVTKYSYTVLFVILIVLGALKIFSATPQVDSFAASRLVTSRRGKALLIGSVFLAAGAVSYLMVWAAYGFRFNAIPDGSAHFYLDPVMLPSLVRPLVLFVHDHHLFPEAWIYGQLYVSYNLQRLAYLWGEVSKNGFLSYFPIAFAMKTPLPTLILLAIGCWMIIRRLIDGSHVGFLLIPAVLYFAFAVVARINIGLRHILFVYPFLFAFAGAVVAKIWRSKAAYKRASLIFLAVWYVGACAWIYPHYLAYFNEVIGGPKNGYKVLIDSNLDWGQDLPGLKRWMDANGVKGIRFSYFGSVDPAYYGIAADYLPGSWILYSEPDTSPSEKVVYTAVSVQNLFGFQVPSRLDPSELKRFEHVKKLQFQKPVATVGYSIFIFYDVDMPP